MEWQRRPPPPHIHLDRRLRRSGSDVHIHLTMGERMLCRQWADLRSHTRPDACAR